MAELGFFMDNLGNVIYYGEWKEQYDKNNRHQVHTSSFEDEVETNPIFISLHLQYDKEMGLYGKAIAFALQGMVTMQNQTSQGETKFMMHVPENLTLEQKAKFLELYPLLSTFSKPSIIIPKTVFISEKDKIEDLDSYYASAGIYSQKVK